MLTWPVPRLRKLLADCAAPRHAYNTRPLIEPGRKTTSFDELCGCAEGSSPKCLSVRLGRQKMLLILDTYVDYQKLLHV